MSDDKPLARSLRVALAYRNKTQTWLAKQLGIERQTVSYWCAGRGGMKHSTLEKVCELLDLKLSEFYKLGEE